jgi:ketosteroid isomerase-like protein
MRQLLTGLLFVILLLQSNYLQCKPSNQVNFSGSAEEFRSQIKHQSKLWQQALVERDLDKTLSIYEEQAILMPEYQPTLNGLGKIREYYTSLNKRRNVRNISMVEEELVMLDQYLLEIGAFESDIDWLSNSAINSQKYTGKYWRIWKVNQSSEIKVFGEAFGFFEPIPNPHLWVTDVKTRQDFSPSNFKPSAASIELKAYHAIGEKGVRQKNGVLRSQLYASDAVFYPFADSPKRGIEVLQPYLVQYSSHGAIIDSVQTHTHEVVYLKDYIIEFTKFAVAWNVDEFPGQANGKGIVLRTRLKNGELRIFRHIGLHNYGE